MQPILETKLCRPRLASDYVARPRLDAELNRAFAEQQLILVTAPAGYGKTTAVVAWLAGLATAPSVAAGSPPVGDGSLPVAWYSPDENDNDLRLFLNSLTAAIELAAPGLLAGSLPLAERLSLPPIAEIVALLVRAVVRWPGMIVVVLDDYQAITNEAVHQFVAQLARYRPPNLRLVITARADPPLPLAQWRAAGQLGELRAAQLAFSADEGMAFVGKVAGEAVSPETRRVLHDHVEGWPAGLRLAALSLRVAGDQPGFLAEFGERSDRPIVDYLVDEVLNRLPPDTHRTLLTTSILDRLQRELCAAVMDTTDVAACQATLEFMDRQNLFIVPLDARHEWYRHHHQFQAMLQRRARVQLSEEELATLHRRAAAWYAARGFLDEALSHDAAAGDTAAMLDLVEAAAPELENEDQWDRLGQLLQRLPEDALWERPALLMALAWYRMLRADLAGLEALLERAEALLRRDGASMAPELLAEAGGELHALWSSSYVRRLSAEARRDHALAALDAVPARRHWVRGYAFSTWVYAAFSPDDVAALDGYLTALAVQGERRHTIHALVLRAQLHWERGATGPALARLAEAVAMGYGRGYRRWYVEQGPVMGEMFHALARDGRLVEEAGALLALLARAGETRPRQEAIAPLSEREMDILEYLDSGLTNKEIAQKLRISPLTVRNHASSLYAKLGVSTRRQAVARARALGLLREGGRFHVPGEERA